MRSTYCLRSSTYVCSHVKHHRIYVEMDKWQVRGITAVKCKSFKKFFNKKWNTQQCWVIAKITNSINNASRGEVKVTWVLWGNIYRTEKKSFLTFFLLLSFSLSSDALNSFIFHLDKMLFYYWSASIAICYITIIKVSWNCDTLLWDLCKQGRQKVERAKLLMFLLDFFFFLVSFFHFLEVL